MFKIGDRVKIKDYSQWDNLEPFKRLVMRYTGRAANEILTVTRLDTQHGLIGVSTSIEDSLIIGSVYVQEDNLESVNLCVTCDRDITHDMVTHPVQQLGKPKLMCEICNDYRLDGGNHG